MSNQATMMGMMGNECFMITINIYIYMCVCVCMYVCLCFSLSEPSLCSFVTVSELFVISKIICTFVILLPIKLPVTSTVFSMTLLEKPLSAFVAGYSKSFWLFLPLQLLVRLLPIFLAKDKSIAIYKYSIVRLN